MIKNKKRHTATIAEIFSEQGYLNYSQIIYRNLLKKEPDNLRLKEGYKKLTDKIERRIDLSDSAEPSKELIFLFSEWINLILTSKKLKELDKFGKKYKI